MSSSPDTLQVVLNKFASMAQSMASKSVVLGLADLVWWLKFLQLEQNFLNYLVAVALITFVQQTLWLFPQCYMACKE